MKKKRKSISLQDKNSIYKAIEKYFSLTTIFSSYPILSIIWRKEKILTFKTANAVGFENIILFAKHKAKTFKNCLNIKKHFSILVAYLLLNTHNIKTNYINIKRYIRKCNNKLKLKMMSYQTLISTMKLNLIFSWNKIAHKY